MAKKKSSKKSKKKSKSKRTLMNDIQSNPWILTSVLLAIAVLVLIFASYANSCPTGNVVSEDVAAQNLVDFASSMGTEAELVGVDEDDNFYEVTLEMEGQEVPIHVTKDGENLVQGVQSLEQSDQDQQQQEEPQETQQEGSYSEEDKTKLKDFNDCLSENEVVVYGSETCPHCGNLVETLGGKEAVENVYVECTENRERCNEEMIDTGVPEIQIDGEKYSGSRSLEGLSEATGCEVPELDN